MLTSQPSVLPEKFRWGNQLEVEDSRPGTPTKNTRASLSKTYSDSSGRITVGKIFAADKRKRLLENLKPSRVFYSSLFERHFHDQLLPSTELFETLNSKYNFYVVDRWKAMPENPVNEKQISEGFYSICQKIWESLSPSDADTFQARFFDTHSTRIPDNHGNSHLQPDVFCQGFGDYFPVVRHSKLSAPPWSVCLAFCNFKLELSKQKEHCFTQLATYAEQLLSAQDNRRFVEAFCMDEKSFILHIFDRGGAITSDLVDYQKDPWKLVALIHYLLLGRNRNPIDAGIDHSIYYQGGHTLIRTPASDVCNIQETWVIHKALFRATDLRGPGTIFWLVSSVSGGEINLTRRVRMIKDEWVVGGCQHESSIYRFLDDTPGLAPMAYAYDVALGDGNDTVSESRPKGSKLNNQIENDRVHTRVLYIVEDDAKTIEMFSNVLEILEGLYDAIKGHRALYRKGILHNEISPQRIIIQPSALQGQRGLLVDLYSAYKLDETWENINMRKRNDVTTFNSRNTPDTMRSPNFLDGLKSFFFVLCFLTAIYDASGRCCIKKPKSAWSNSIPSWLPVDSQPALNVDLKSMSFLNISCPYKVGRSFPLYVQTLVEQWWGIFHANESKIMLSEDTTIIPDAEDTYEKLLEHIHEAILSFYEQDAHVNGISKEGNRAGKRIREGDCSDRAAKHSRNM